MLSVSLREALGVDREANVPEECSQHHVVTEVEVGGEMMAVQVGIHSVKLREVG